MKVKLPKNKAQAFDELAAFGKEDILAGVMGYGCNSKYPEGKTWSELRALAKHDFETFLQALANGYEVIEEPQVITITPGQLADVLRYYDNLQDADAFTQGERDRHKNILRQTLRLIGFKWEELQ